MAIPNHQIAKTCSICGQHNARLKYQSQKTDPAVMPGAFSPVAKDFGIFHDLYQCESCHHIFAQITDVDIDLLYKKAEDPGNYFFLWEHRMENLGRLFRRVFPLLECKSPNVLDIGAGGGIFLNLLKKLGLHGLGLEPSTQLVELGKKKFGVILSEGTLRTIPLQDSSFDLITFLEVIEHLQSPREEIELASRCLTQKGKILLVTPNMKSFSARCFGSRWWSFRQMHIQYFSTTSLDALMKHTGFRLVWSGCFFKSFPLSYYMSNLFPFKITIPRLLDINLRMSLGDMARLYVRNE
jgi:2-polyprenyl-3-methyl-5-hydroxy-6-metoxy-1,4-benzoquinol methylase